MLVKTVLCPDSLLYWNMHKQSAFIVYFGIYFPYVNTPEEPVECFCFSSLTYWEGRKQLLVGSEPRPERVHVVLEVDVSATKTSVGRSYSYFALYFISLLFSPALLIPPKSASLPTPSWKWMNNSPLSWCRVHECVHALHVRTVRVHTYVLCVREWLVQITEPSKTLVALHFLCCRTLGLLVTDQLTRPAAQPQPQEITHNIWTQKSLRYWNCSDVFCSSATLRAVNVGLISHLFVCCPGNSGHRWLDLDEIWRIAHL